MLLEGQTIGMQSKDLLPVATIHRVSVASGTFMRLIATAVALLPIG